MGGDYVKHSFPLATNMMLLAWTLMRFESAYEKVCLVPGTLTIQRTYCGARSDKLSG
jgi:hypothetical protein